MMIKRVIELEEDTLKRIDEAKSVPDMFGTDIVNGLNAIKYGKPYDEAEVWKKSNELLEKRLAYLGKPIIKCQDCKYRVKEWREDDRMKEKGYWVYGCEHFGEIMGYWGFGGNDNEFCSDAEPKGGAE